MTQREYDALLAAVEDTCIPLAYYTDDSYCNIKNAKEAIRARISAVAKVEGNCMNTSSGETTVLTVEEYRFSSNDCIAITEDGQEIIFDPFVGCVIELSDDEYYSKSKAPKVVGHRFVVKRSSVHEGLCTPSDKDVVSTDWKEVDKP